MVNLTKMSYMGIHSEKALLIKRLNEINDVSLIKALNHMVDFGLKASSRENISIEQYNLELDEVDAEIDRGEFISHEYLKKQMKGW